MVEMENLNARNFLRVLGMYADHVKERYMFAFEWSLFASFLLDVAIIFALHSTFINQVPRHTFPLLSPVSCPLRALTSIDDQPMCFSQTQLDEIGAGRSNWDVLAVEVNIITIITTRRATRKRCLCSPHSTDFASITDPSLFSCHECARDRARQGLAAHPPRESSLPLCQIKEGSVSESSQS